MSVPLPAVPRFTARTMARIQHTHLRPAAAILVRSISTIANPSLFGNETPNFAKISLQLMQDSRMDRHRYDSDRHRFDSDRHRWETERRHFYATDKRQSVIIAELKKEALDLLEKKVRFEQNFNVRGGLERICYQAVLEKRIVPAIGVQARLDALAKTAAFQKVYSREIEAHGLILLDVERCRRNIYHELSKHAHGNDGVIQIRHADFTVNEMVAVLAYYKMQDEWKDCMKWEEHTAEKDHEKPGKDETV